jgi:hypothetical protein
MQAPRMAFQRRVQDVDNMSEKTVRDPAKVQRSSKKATGVAAEGACA